MREC